MPTHAHTIELARLWRRIIQTDPKALFGRGAARLLDRNWGDRIAQPGYVGPDYEPGGLVFISMNPGGGPQEGLGPEDLAQYETLVELREADDAGLLSAFLRLSQLLGRVMPTWKIYSNFVAPVLQHARLEFSRVAYLNLLKWRTSKSSGLARLYEASWTDHTQGQIELLQPRIIVAIGTDAGNAFRRHFTGTAHFDSIPRVVGNNIGEPGRAAIRRIGSWFEANSISEKTIRVVQPLQELPVQAPCPETSENKMDESMLRPETTIATLDYLESQGFNDEEFRLLHHVPHETIHGHREYCRKSKQGFQGVDSKNSLVCRRLLLVRAYHDARRALADSPAQPGLFELFARAALVDVPK